MGLDLGYKVDVAAIPIEILSKFPLSPLQNVLEHCHDCQESVSKKIFPAMLLHINKSIKQIRATLK